MTNYLSILGAVGMTAYFGLLEVCEPKPGDTVLVTGAAGAVGSLVGQIAKIQGCRVIGIAGGAEKCARLTERYGFDAAIDYRGKDLDALTAAIKAEAPDGVDVIFENVGGDILDAGLNNLRHGARIGLCGLISEYNSTERGRRAQPVAADRPPRLDPRAAGGRLRRRASARAARQMASGPPRASWWSTSISTRASRTPFPPSCGCSRAPTRAR